MVQLQWVLKVTEKCTQCRGSNGSQVQGIVHYKDVYTAATRDQKPWCCLQSPLVGTLYPSHHILSFLFLKLLLNPPLFRLYCISLKPSLCFLNLLDLVEHDLSLETGDFSAKWNLNPLWGIEGLPWSSSTSSSTFTHYHSAKLSSPQDSFNSLISYTRCPLTMECPLHCMSKFVWCYCLSMKPFSWPFL